MTDQRRRVIVRRIFVAQSADVLTYAVFIVLTMSVRSIHTERDPIIVFVAGLGGVVAVVALKLGLAGIVEWRAHQPVTVTRRAYWPVWTIMASAAAASGIAGAGFNLAALLRLQG